MSNTIYNLLVIMIFAAIFLFLFAVLALADGQMAKVTDVAIVVSIVVLMGAIIVGLFFIYNSIPALLDDTCQVEVKSGC